MERPRCWNRVQISIALLNEQTAAYLAEIAVDSPWLRRAVAEIVLRDQQRRGRRRGRSLESLDAQIASLKSQAENLLKAIKLGRGKCESLVVGLGEVEVELGGTLQRT